MENNIDLKALWNQQPVPAVDSTAVKARLAKLAIQKRKSLWIVNGCLIATSLFISWIWFYYQPQFLTTKIGIVLVIAAMLMYMFVFNKLIPLYKALDATQFNKAYLDGLIQIRERERYLQTKIMNIYYLVLSAGLGLYMYEYASRMEMVWALMAYGFTIAWIVFSWFYIRTRQIQKNREKMERVIQQVQAILNQLKQSEQHQD